MDEIRNERMVKEAQVHLAIEAKETLRLVEEELPDSPTAMKYFHNLLGRIFSGESEAPKSPTAKSVGMLCVHVPEELIYAAGAVPVRLCSGSYAYAQAGADLLPAKACPLVKASMGMLRIRSLSSQTKLDLIVNPTTCDQKRKAGELIEELGYRVHHLELPPSKDSEEARVYWRRSVQKFARVLEKTTGHAITGRRLERAIGTVRAAQTAYRKLLRIMQTPGRLICGTDAMLVTHAYFFDDPIQWTSAVSALVEELKERRDSGFRSGNTQAPRILFAGSPPIFPNLKIPLLIELAGGLLVADEVCSSSRLLYDMVAFDEPHRYDMIPAVADRYLKPCTCPIFNSGLDRKRRLVDLASSFAVDGIVYQSFAGCMPYALEQRSVGKILSDVGIPVLIVETDYGSDDAGQLTTRVEAFIESLKARKRRSA
jgi:benzoyl-CoA reductase/2-hydroxyglutaryl-CoA dehydratase subunit BcrC/BadD/HgdB